MTTFHGPSQDASLDNVKTAWGVNVISSIAVELPLGTTTSRGTTARNNKNMYLAKVIGKVVSIMKHPAYQNRTLLLVQPLSLKAEVVRTPTIAVDYVGAGEGDTVIVGAGPGVAQEVFGIEDAPIRELVMGIVDSFVVREAEQDGQD